MRDFNSFLAPLMREFVTFQEASGRWNEPTYAVSLARFDKHCKTQYPYACELTQDMVDSWCRQRKTEINNSCVTRIYAVVGFIRYLRKRGKTTVKDPLIPRKEPSIYIPHAFTEAELVKFFAVCDAIPGSYAGGQLTRRITIPVFFRLLYSSGIRTNEARLLRREDVDLSHGVLNIRSSKGYAQHYVVLHDSMTSLLKQYDAAISKQYPDRNYFFPARNDSFHLNKWVQNNFRCIWSQCSESCATAYELRHNYAIENINRWTDEGFGFHKRLLYLSRSMGHSVLESTKYYYSLVPGLANILETQTDDDMIPEVTSYESL